MKRAIPLVGAIGAGALVAGFLLRLFQPQRDEFWASFLLVGLVFTIFFLGARWREVMVLVGRRGARYGANLGLLIVLVVGILVAINYIANRHNKRWDLTAAKLYTLSDQTTKILENLDRDLKIIIFERKDAARAALDLLDQYRYLSRRVSVEVVDQEAQPARAAKYQTSTEAGIPFGTIVIDAGDKVERVSGANEQDITNAIIKVIKDEKKKIYFVEGHGEKDLDESSATGISLIKAKLEDSNYQVGKFHPLEAMQEGNILLPEDATAFVIAGPHQDYLPAEIETFRSYLEGGGKAIFLIDPENQGTKPNLVALMNDFGIELGNNVVIDVSGVGQLFGFGPEVPLVTTYGSHPITEKFSNVASVYPFVRTAEPTGSPAEGITVTSLASSSDNSWAEQDLDELAEGQVRPDDDEEAGPLTLAATLTIEVEEPAAEADSGESDPATPAREDTNGDEAEPSTDEGDDEEEPKKVQGRAVVVGDSDFIANSLAGAPVANLNLFLNMVNWIAEDEDLISIRPREPEDRRLFMNQQQQKNVFYLSVFIIPALVLISGISVWWGRR